MLSEVAVEQHFMVPAISSVPVGCFIESIHHGARMQ